MGEFRGSGITVAYDGETIRLVEGDVVHAQATVVFKDGTAFISRLESFTGLHGYRLMREIQRLVGGRRAIISVDVSPNMERLARMYTKRFGVEPIAVLFEKRNQWDS